jgi:sRNA-binding carbon storage regulator CsrA
MPIETKKKNEELVILDDIVVVIFSDVILSILWNFKHHVGL